MSFEIKNRVLVSYTKESDFETVTIPEGVEIIGPRVFSSWGCGRFIRSVILPPGVKKIERSAFKECINLRTVEAGEGLEEIGYEAFANCRNLTAVTVPSTLTRIDSYAFQNCRSLERICLKSVTELGSSAFAGCSSLEAAELCDALPVINMCTFSNCSRLKTVVLPASLSEIGLEAFRNCSSLEDIRFPEGLRRILHRAFMGCSSLKSARFPEGLESIEPAAFADCVSLKEIFVPASLKDIPAVFIDCRSLEQVHSADAQMPLDGSMFPGCGRLVINGAPALRGPSDPGELCLRGSVNHESFETPADHPPFSSRLKFLSWRTNALGEIIGAVYEADYGSGYGVDTGCHELTVSIGDQASFQYNTCAISGPSEWDTDFDDITFRIEWNKPV